MGSKLRQCPQQQIACDGIRDGKSFEQEYSKGIPL